MAGVCRRLFLAPSSTKNITFSSYYELIKRWYISAGLNKIFDTFDCQVHFFTSPYPGKFYAKLFWRINEPDGMVEYLLLASRAPSPYRHH